MTSARMRTRGLSIVLALTCPWLLAPVAGAAPAAHRCGGRTATIVGTARNDVLEGTPGRDVIVGGKGNDRIQGLGGPDLLCGGPGMDRLRGGRGRDRLLGGSDNDRLFGGAGDDVLVGGPDHDLERGGAGDDTFDQDTRENGGDQMLGGAGTDSITYAERGERLRVSLDGSRNDGGGCGDEGDDAEVERVVGGRKADLLRGSAGADVLVGGPGPDTLEGLPGDDLLRAGDGDDVLAGGGGNDVLDGGAGDNRTCVELKTCDVAPPELRAFDIAPRSIDTSAAAAEISFTARFADDLAGITYGRAHFRSPSRSQGVETYFGGCPADGSDRDATLTDRERIPRFAEQGTWTLTRIEIHDRVGNDASLDGADIAAAGWPTTFEQVGVGDVTPPALLSLDISPGHIDTSGGQGTVVLTARITDDLSGLADNGIVSDASFTSATGGYGGSTIFATRSRASGTALDGIYRPVLSVPRYAPQGTWRIGSLYLRDAAGNGRSYSRDALIAAGFPVSFEQTGAGDSAPPTLIGLDFTPTAIDTSESDRTITLTGHVTDDLSGYREMEVRFTSPSGNQSVFRTLYDLDRISGGPTNGTYRVGIIVPRYSEHGTWTLERVVLRDEVFNARGLTTWQLSAAGFPTTFTNGP